MIKQTPSENTGGVFYLIDTVMKVMFLFRGTSFSLQDVVCFTGFY